MAVESSIFPIRDVIFEHRIYLPSVGFFMAITASVALTVQNWRTGTNVAWILIVAVCSLLGGMTISRNQVWNDPLVLWQEAVSKAPNKWLALSNLAEQYLYHNMPEKALPLYVRALELQSDLFPMTKVHLGDTLKALNIFASRFTTGQELIISGGDFGKGTIGYYNRPTWDSIISNNMGLAYEYLKEPEKAKNAYLYAVAKNPAYDLGWFNLALISSRLDDNVLADEALVQLQTLNQPMAEALSLILQSAILH
jgi:tetratricopeptide (TPR) repeat protein